ncbi:MAG: alpha/beta fold hydrolase [Pseudomonadota bacterium]
MTERIAPPTLRAQFGELFAAKDMLGMPLSLAKAHFSSPEIGNRYPIIVLPGIGAADASTAPLRYFLKQNGYQVEGWGLGRNLGGRGMIEDLNELSDSWDVDRTRDHNGEGEVPALCDRMVERVETRVAELGSPVVLIGWSLGGYVAREVARELPRAVAGIITMGSPAFGGPKFTSAAPIFKRRNVDLDWIEAEVARRYGKPIAQPITAIYSKSDGVVAWKAAIDNLSPNVKHIEVNVSHIGLGLNSNVWNIVLDELASEAFS